MIIKRVGNPNGPLTGEQLDGNFDDLDTRMKYLEGVLDQRIAGVVGLDRVEAAENREAVNFVFTDGRVFGPFGGVPRLNPVAPWESGRSMEMLDLFEHLGTAYIARVDHVAANFDADRAAGKLIQLLPYSQAGFEVVGEYNPALAYPAGKAVWLIPDPTAQEDVEIWVAPKDVAVGVYPPMAPWVLSGTNALTNLREVDSKIGDIDIKIDQAVELTNIAALQAAEAAAAVEAQASVIAALQAKVGDLKFADVKDTTRTNLAVWASSVDGSIEDLWAAIEAEEEPEDPEEPTEPETIAAANVTTTAAGVSAQDKLDDLETRVTALQAAGGGSTGPVAADAFTVDGVTLTERLGYLDDQNSATRGDIVEIESAIEDLQAAQQQPGAVTAADITTDQGPSVQATLDDLGVGVEQALDGEIPASRVTSAHIAEPNLDQWLFTVASQLSDLASSTGPTARLDALDAHVAYGLATDNNYADLGQLLRGLVNRIAALEDQVATLSA